MEEINDVVAFSATFGVVISISTLQNNINNQIEHIDFSLIRSLIIQIHIRKLWIYLFPIW